MNSEKATENTAPRAIGQNISGWDSVIKLADKMGEVTSGANNTDDDLDKNIRDNEENQKNINKPAHNMTVGEFAAEIGLSKVSLYERIRGLEDFVMKKEKREGSRVAVSILSEEQQRLLKELIGMPPPPGYISVNDFSAEHGITAGAVRGRIPKEELLTFREKGEKIKKQYLSEKQQKDLLDWFRIAPKDYMVIDDFADSIGVNEKFILQRIPKSQLEKFKDPKTHQSRTYLSRELRDSFLSTIRPPNGYRRLTEFLKDNGLDKTDENILSVLSGLSIDQFMGEDDYRPIDYVSQAQQDLILSSIRPPEGYLSYDEFARQANIEITRLSDYISDLGIKEEVKKYRADSDSRRRYYLSPD